VEVYLLMEIYGFLLEIIIALLILHQKVIQPLELIVGDLDIGDLNLKIKTTSYFKVLPILLVLGKMHLELLTKPYLLNFMVM
jgi:hypothetical protein